MNSNSDNTYSKADRFAKLSEKLSQLHSVSQNETMNPNSKLNQIENRLLDVDNKVTDNYEILDKKYNNLKDQVAKLTKIIEEEKHQKDILKTKQAEDFRNLEVQIKSLLEEEQQNMQNFADNLINKIDLQIHEMDKEYKNDNEIIKNSISALKENFENELVGINSRMDVDNEERVKIMRNLVSEMNTELGKVHELIETETKKREESESTFVSTIEEIMKKFKEELKKEKKEREMYEENIFNLIEETCMRLSKSNMNDD